MSVENSKNKINNSLKILALEPYYGGSHKAFIDGWIKRSRHNWTLLTLPPSKWKWRMRHSAVTFANEAGKLLQKGKKWDVLFCSDMLNLAEFFGLFPEAGRLTSIVYFHENQLTYPVEHESEFDYHFAFSNMTTALAAKRVWFNSIYHRDSFLDELTSFLKRMPDYQPLEVIDMIRAKSDIRHPCIDKVKDMKEENNRKKPIHILWAARWEYDKAPEMFFRVIEIINKTNLDFRISVIGGNGGRNPMPIFEDSRKKFVDKILYWGYIETRDEYEKVLSQADVVVSTADHEFFGIGILEAVAFGTFPIIPDKLAYPEIFSEHEGNKNQIFFYDGTEKDLILKLKELILRFNAGKLWKDNYKLGIRIAEKYLWENVVSKWDNDLSNYFLKTPITSK